jgi:hypothetical protein
MTIPDIAVWILRGFGVLWVVGGIFALRQVWIGMQVGGMIETLDKMTDEFADPGAPPKREREPEDKGRDHWLMAGSVLLIICGAAMAVGHRVAVPLLLALIIQQMSYFVRQRRRELAAKTEEGAAEARPTRQTVNGFFTSLVMATLAAWLYYEGKLL